MIRVDVALTMGVWVETFLYGIYTCLFIAAVSAMLKRRSFRGTNIASSWVFLIATIMMYIVATFHLIIQFYRFLRAFILVVEPQGYLAYFENYKRWDNVAFNVLVCLMTWMGDALVIYRCYLVWNSNIWVITLPTLLLLCALGVNAYVLYFFTHPFNVDLKVGMQLLNAIYPLAFVQNVMTTGLIVLKIWSQHRASSASGVATRSSRLSLIRVLRIVIESAMIILQSAIVQSIGIVFVLLAARVHVARSSPTISNGIETTLPAWLEDGESDSRSELDRDASSPGVGVTFRVSSDKLPRVDSQ